MLTGLFDTLNPRPLGLARIIVGAAALIRVFVALPTLLRLADEVTMKAPYADWLPDPSLPLVITLATVWVLASVLFTLGWRVSLSGPGLVLSIATMLALDEQTYANHLYLTAWLVMLLTLASAGAGINLRRTDTPVIRWPVLLVMAQLSIVYGFSALTKLNEGFLTGRVLAGTLGTGLLGFPEALRTPRILSIVAAATVFIELFIAVFIWRRRFRPAAYILGLGLHTSITLLMDGTFQLLVFSLLMFALYPLFLSPEKLVLIWDDTCDYCRTWIGRFNRLDLLRVVDPVGASDPRNDIPTSEVERAMHLIHADETSRGFRSVGLTLEHLVPTLWFAPLLRVPGISQLGQRWYQWQARRRSCLVGETGSTKVSPGSTAR